MAAVTWTDYNNGATGLAVRTAINLLGTQVKAWGDVSGILTTNTGNIAINRADLDVVETKVAVLEAPQDTILFTPQLTAPPFVQGQVYFDEEEDVLVVQGTSADGSIYVGHMMHVHVYNNTGVTLQKGKAVKFTGLFGGMATVGLALADNYINSFVAGLTAMDILPGTIGAVNTMGVFKDWDTSLLTPGPVYLSDTVPGELTSVKPDIVSLIGVVTKQDAAAGSINLRLIANLELPTTTGVMQGQSIGTYVLSSLYQEISGYVTEDTIVSISDLVNGSILVPLNGLYDITFTFNGTITDEEEDLFIQVYDKTNDIELYVHQVTSGRGANPVLVPISTSFTVSSRILSDNTEIQIRVKSDGSTETLQLANANFSVRSLDVR